VNLRTLSFTALIRAAVICGVLVTAPAVVRATIIASDNAGNTAYSDGFQTGDNGGSGFTPWTLSSSGGTGGFGGNFVGNPVPAGITNFGTLAFGQFANPGSSGAFANADRGLAAPLNVGDKLSLQWAVNFDANSGGSKGFNLYSGGTGGTQILNVNMAGTAAITVDGTNTGFAYGTNPMTWSFEMTNASTMLVTATPRAAGGTSFSQSFAVAGPPDAFRFYASGLDGGDARQPYFNNFEVVAPVPEPHAAMLGIAALLPTCLMIRRLRRTTQPG